MIRQGGLFIVLGSILLFQGCAKKKSDTQGWGSFPVAIYSDSAIETNPEAQADLHAAFSFWESRAGKRLFDYKGPWKGSAPFAGDPGHPSAIFANVIFFQNPWPFAQTVAGQTVVLSTDSRFDGSIVMINPNTATCTGDCRGATLELSQTKVFTHELGHFLGLQHVQDSTNIMYPSLGAGGTLESVSVDTATLASLTN